MPYVVQIDPRINSPENNRSRVLCQVMGTPLSQSAATITDTAALDASICNYRLEFPGYPQLPGLFQALSTTLEKKCHSRCVEETNYSGYNIQARGEHCKI